MASLGTSDPSAPDTFWYRMRAPDRLSIWLNDTDLRDTALKSFTGMLTSPKLIDPLQMALGMAKVYVATSDDTTAQRSRGHCGFRSGDRHALLVHDEPVGAGDHVGLVHRLVRGG